MENNQNITTVPSKWPGAFGAYKYSKKAVMLNLPVILLLVGVITVLQIVQLPAFLAQLTVISDPTFVPPPQNIFLKIADNLSTIIGWLVGIALTITYIEGVRNNKVKFKDIVKRSVALPVLLNMFALTVITIVILVISLLLLVIPFFFVIPRLALAPYFLLDQKLNSIDSITASWKATKGHSAKIWGIFGAATAMVLLMFTIIGIPFALYFMFMYGAAGAVLYKYIKNAGPAKS